MKGGEKMLDKLIAELKRARNELCIRCGCYQEAHKGACNGCHWKDEWREVIEHGKD